MNRERGSSADQHGPARTEEIDLPVIGMYCANCAKAVERALKKKVKGVEDATVNYAAEQVHLKYDPRLVPMDKLANAVHEAGYRLVLPDPDDDPGNAEAVARREEIAKQKKALSVGLAFTIPLFILSMGRDWGMVPAVLGDHFLYNIVLFLLATPVQFYTGKGYYLGAWHSLRNRNANMDVLVALGSTTAYVYSVIVMVAGTGHLYFEAAAMIITLIKLGKWLEIRAKGKAGTAIQDLMKRVPPTVHLIDEMGEYHDMPLNAVRPGDMVRVKPGETIPVDGVIDSGTTSIDVSLLTGESTPYDAETGDEVYGGTINQQGAINVKVMKPGSDSAIARIVKRVKAAQGSKAPIQRLADRVAAVFVPVIVGVALLTLVVWLVLTGSIETALVRMVAVLVIACPCAMGLATPTAIITGMGAGAKKGILYRDAEAVEAGAKIRLVAFDKTGTLTLGEPELSTLHVVGKTKTRELLELAASALKSSSHPLASAAVKMGKEKGIIFHDSAMFEEEAGFGVRTMLDNGRLIHIGRPEAFEELPGGMENAISEMRENGETVSVVADRYGIIGVLGFRDKPRDEARDTVQQLRQMGMRTAMLSGDHKAIVNSIGQELGLDYLHSEQHPEDKEAAVLAYRKKIRGGVAVVGDGINDAPALARADLGIAIGSGADVAIEVAGISLPSDDLRNVPRAIKLSRKTVAVIRQNLFWAFAYNVALVPVAAGVLAIFPAAPAMLQQLHPALAAGAMAISSITVVMNSLRLR
ncbi:heavy metal translocating P-type ATPase [bacterium]|nr:heavy metal translocating P-type ATPase [bacterium]